MGDGYGVVTVRKDVSGRIIVSFPYNPQLVAKVKTIPNHQWHPTEKHWSFPNTDGKLKKILKVFDGEEIHLDPALQKAITISPSKIKIPSPQWGEGKASPEQSRRGEGLLKT